jgi:glycosyltransferase involved in cell wall biosynthesis
VKGTIRVAILTDNDFEKVNGVTTALGEVLAHAPSDVRVRVYTASGLGCNTPDYLALPSWGVGIPFYADMRMYWPPYRALLRRLRDDRVDVLHLTTPGPMGLAALAAARRLGVPLVGSFHTDLARYTAMLSGSRTLETFMRRYMRWLYAHCSVVLVPSVATRTLVAESGVPLARLQLWGRGVDSVTFDPARRSQALRDEWRARVDRPVLLYVGRVSREKGVDQLPELHDRLLRLGVDHKLVVAGDGPMRTELASACPEAIRLGTLGRAHLADVYASADVFVFPSRTDTAGNVVLEAQASGLPVVVADAGGPSEQMIHGVTGTVCAADAETWLTAVARLLTDAEQRTGMGRAARAFALSRTWPSALEPLYRTYRDVAGAHSIEKTSPRRVA